MHILVTGARGFIGSAFIRSLVNSPPQYPLRITALVHGATQWTRPRLAEVEDAENLRLINGDLTGDISGICEGVDVVVHFAAKTYVDHSIKDPLPFVRTNVLGTAHLLEDARRHGVQGFITISTDEVYGEILSGAYDEDAPLCPRNPYSASKAGADALTISYYHTFGMWTAVTRTENNYGPFQHPQKAMPVFIGKALNNEKLPVYGDGQHVRQWLYVDDHVQALRMLIDKRTQLDGGQIWHVAGGQEITNEKLAQKIMDNSCPSQHLSTGIEYIDDMDIRPGHDRRYALRCSKMRGLGWKPQVGLDEGIAKVVEWYKYNKSWR